MSYTFTLKEIDQAAEWLLDQIGNHKIIALNAVMGAGKTTLVKAIMKSLGTKDNISSPTYAIVNEYHTENSKYNIVYHMDLYRLQNIEELESLPIEDYLDSGHLCIIEWPQLAEPFFNKDVLQISIEQMNDGSRKMLIL